MRIEAWQAATSPKRGSITCPCSGGAGPIGKEGATIMRKRMLEVVRLAGMAALVLAAAGCFKTPTDPFTGGGSGQNGNVPVINSDSHTTAINAAASQANSSGIYLSVVDQDGNALSSSSFAGANFGVVYQGTQVSGGTITISTASSSGQAISSSLVLDFSGSMDSYRADLENAATAFVNNMGAADRGEIVKFDQIVAVAQAYTADKNLLRNAIPTGSSEFGGSTAFYDATYRGIQDTASESGQRAVVAFTDGYENASSIILTQSDLINQARSRGIPIFTIGFGAADTTGLQTIASSTNGQYYYAPTSTELTAIYQRVAQIFSNTMIISWSGFTYTSGATVVITVTYACATGTYTSTINFILP